MSIPWIVARVALCVGFVGSAVYGITEDGKEMRDRRKEPDSKPEPRPGFVIGELTGRDEIARLEWLREPLPGRVTWWQAKLWCSVRNVEGTGDGWRLPTRDELMTLLSAKRDPFGDTLDWYWSITPGVRPGSAWAVAEGAWINANPVETQSRARCVRNL